MVLPATPDHQIVSVHRIFLFHQRVGVRHLHLQAALVVAVLVIAASTFLEATLAVQYMVGGAVAKWSFLQPNSNLTFYNDWAKNSNFKTGDSLRRGRICGMYPAYDACRQVVYSILISKAGTYYFICGTPLHCNQGMKLSIPATGEFVEAPPPPAPAPNPAPNASHATSTSIFSGDVSLLVLALSALIAVSL
nr:uclacyanin 1-like [Physcomitrium patens]|eukprot:XP_024374000.1 uclacyanin 1-like [Physcomitrella patens]